MVLSYETKVHFSPYGHRWMRNAILTALRALKVEQHDEVNDWAAKDECNNFYTDGDLRGMLKDPALVLNQFQDDKWALEMDSNNNNNNSTWIKVVNSLDHPAEVVLSYMSMGPISTSYPTVRVEVSRAGGGGVRIVPYEKERAYPVHVVQQKGVGVIPPGHSKMTITVLKPNQDPFRIVGIMITPREIPMPVVGV
mmetsp:Transcript_24690/g.35230  ORF Transcript_24690/g.35230 Transcript_24690/m.35230 type:complete len:195 (+) Transcript_24690:39-623(+)